MAQLKMEGRSGCFLTIHEDGDNQIVRKKSASIDYNERLHNQCQKQNSFLTSPRLQKYITTTKILSDGYTEDRLYYFDMEYAYGDKFTDFFLKSSAHDVKNILKIYLDYFDNIFKYSEKSHIDSSFLLSKVDSVENKIKSKDEIKKILEFLTEKIPHSPIPIGYCHGDFTLSNMIIDSSQKIYLIDFLDSFINSPIIDLIKLRQDTKFRWSLEIDRNFSGHKYKVIQILNYIDSEIEIFLKKMNKDVIDWYNYLEIFNLFRILPYLTRRDEEIFLLEKINNSL